MKTILSIVRHPLGLDQSAVVRSLVYLRLIMLGATAVFVCSWHFAYAVFDQLLLTAMVLISLGLWSMLLLSQVHFQQTKNAILRELLIEFLWVLLVVLMAGRSANPFIYYYLVLTAVSATVLPARQAWSLCFTGIAIYSTLLLLDSKQHFAHLSADYRIHLIGMWLNYVGSTLVSCFFVVKLIKLLRFQHEQLALVREENLKNEQLIGLATVAASTVHSLATPISTLSVLVENLVDNADIDEEIRGDAHLMRTQISRCHVTMKELSSLAQRGEEQLKLSIKELVEFLQEHYALHYPHRMPAIDCNIAANVAISCNVLVQYALVNLINNAIESSSQAPTIVFTEIGDLLQVVIENPSDLSAEVISKRWGKLAESEKNTGLGIGSFLANSTIEKQGGTVSLETFVDTLDSTGVVIVVTVLFPLQRD